MTHPSLSAVMAAEIPATAKLLYSAMYARTNGAMSGSVAVDDLRQELGGISSGTLRNLRAALAPWAITAVERGYLLFFLQQIADEPHAETHATDAFLHATDAKTHDGETAPDEPHAETHATDAFLHATDAKTHDVPPTPPEEEELLNSTGTKTTPPPLTPPTPAEQKRTYALLTDELVGMSWDKARRCQQHPFARCLAHVLAWQTEAAAMHRAGNKKPFGAGLLVHRILNNFPTPALTWDHDQLDLVRRHAPELLAQPEEPDLPDEAAPPPPCPPAPLAWLCTTPVPCGDTQREAHEVWTMALSQLKLQMTKSTYETWVRDTRCQAYGDGGFVIAVPSAYAKEWLALRLRPTIKRTLTAIVGHAVDVSFEVSGGVS